MEAIRNGPVHHHDIDDNYFFFPLKEMMTPACPSSVSAEERKIVSPPSVDLFPEKEEKLERFQDKDETISMRNVEVSMASLSAEISPERKETEKYLTVLQPYSSKLENAERVTPNRTAQDLKQRLDCMNDDPTIGGSAVLPPLLQILNEMRHKCEEGEIRSITTEQGINALTVFVSNLVEGEKSRMTQELNSLSIKQQQNIMKLEKQLQETKHHIFQRERMFGHYVENLKSTTKIVTSDLTKSHGRVKTLIRELEEAKMINMNLAEDIADLNSTAASLKSNLAEALGRENNLNNDLEKLRKKSDTEADDFRSLVSKLQEEKSTLETELKTLKKETACKTAKAHFDKFILSKRRKNLLGADAQQCALKEAMTKNQSRKTWAFFGQEEDSILDVEDLMKDVLF